MVTNCAPLLGYRNDYWYKEEFVHKLLRDKNKTSKTVFVNHTHRYTCLALPESFYKLPFPRCSALVHRSQCSCSVPSPLIVSSPFLLLHYEINYIRGESESYLHCSYSVQRSFIVCLTSLHCFPSVHSPFAKHYFKAYLVFVHRSFAKVERFGDTK
jgi:hypothetical protein